MSNISLHGRGSRQFFSHVDSRLKGGPEQPFFEEYLETEREPGTITHLLGAKGIFHFDSVGGLSHGSPKTPNHICS